MNKLSKLTLLCAAFAGMMACSDGKVAKGDYGIIPLPQEVSMINGGSFVLTPSTSIVYPEGNDLLANFWLLILKKQPVMLRKSLRQKARNRSIFR